MLCYAFSSGSVQTAGHQAGLNVFGRSRTHTERLLLCELIAKCATTDSFTEFYRVLCGQTCHIHDKNG